MTATATYKAETGGHEGDSPFKPLFTIRRSGRIEVTVYGMVSVVAGLDNRNAQPGERYGALPCLKLTGTGDTGFELWSRSLLKPWQLLSNYQILKDSYPGLTDKHFALFMASHSAEPAHLEALEEILAITQVDENLLKCPPANPLDAASKEAMKARGEKARRRYHNCSGKHSGYLAAVKASQGADHMKDYLRESEAHHTRLKHILSTLTGRPESSFTATTDGCQLPNYALSVAEMSYFYMTLLNHQALPPAALTEAAFAPYDKLGALMLKNPRMVSGLGRLDYKIMAREIFADAPAMVAKEGADGLLGVGVAPSERYPNGVGIAIKLSAGFDSHHMELITREILTALQLTAPSAKSDKVTDSSIRTDHIQTEFHFLAGLKK
ncbi:MAG: asparaginase [Cyanobacteria bacterium SZAS TMP-1]|nr:asparaginase [Cyanobacteria bacterium SZAS TMP-1]